MVFFERPLSATFLAMAVILLLIVIAPNVRKKREQAFQE
jgi:putative tricarboxylic transport membrane protein